MLGSWCRGTAGTRCYNNDIVMPFMLIFIILDGWLMAGWLRIASTVCRTVFSVLKDDDTQ